MMSVPVTFFASAAMADNCASSRSNFDDAGNQSAELEAAYHSTFELQVSNFQEGASSKQDAFHSITRWY